MGGLHARAPVRIEDRLARRGGAVELLRIPAALFGGLARLRGALYDRRWLPVLAVETPVISVGNVVAGGTGKTPFVAWLCARLAARGLRPGILSRGYRPRAFNRPPAPRSEAPNDEARMLAELLPDVPHIQDRDRVRGAGALEARGVDVIVLDDGFQHRRLARDLDLVLVDATRPWGLPAPPEGGAPVKCVLPRGFLRESPRELARAHAIVMTRCEQSDARTLDELEGELHALAPAAAILRAEHRPSAVREGAFRLTPDVLAGRELRLVSGIGNPEAFERTVRALGATVLGVHAFPDHHAFQREELVELARAGGELCVTAKDAVKLEELGVPFLALEVELALVRGAAVLEALLDALPASAQRAGRLALHEGLHG